MVNRKSPKSAEDNTAAIDGRKKVLMCELKDFR